MSVMNTKNTNRNAHESYHFRLRTTGVNIKVDDLVGTIAPRDAQVPDGDL